MASRPSEIAELALETRRDNRPRQRALRLIDGIGELPHANIDGCDAARIAIALATPVRGEHGSYLAGLSPEHGA